MSPDPERFPEIAHRLLAWFFRHRRDLAWREESDPYRVWVSEVMLQQTRVETVGPFYRRFLERFPDISTLAAASEEEVLKLWEGLGYYGRARSLHRAARALSAERGGRFPEDPAAVRALPGIGPYTAAAVLSIAFARPLGVVDGNVVRVVARLLADGGDPASAGLRARVLDFVERSFNSYHPGWINQAWMELGALVCRPVPDCPACPLAFTCRAFQQGRTGELPARRPPAPRPVRKGLLYLLLPPTADAGLRATLTALAAGAAVDSLPDTAPLLLVRRPSRGLLGGLWEFPNVGEEGAGEFCSTHHLQTLGSPGPEVRHAYSHFEVRLRPVPGVLERDVRLAGWTEQRWVAAGELGRYPRPRVHIKAMRRLGLGG